MTKRLIIGPGCWRTKTWRLPPETDLNKLEQIIKDAVRSQNIITVEVELNDNPLHPVHLILYGRALEFSALVDLPEDGLAGSPGPSA